MAFDRSDADDLHYRLAALLVGHRARDHAEPVEDLIDLHTSVAQLCCDALDVLEVLIVHADHDLLPMAITHHSGFRGCRLRIRGGLA